MAEEIFFKTKSGNAINANDEYKGGSLDPMPDNTECQAYITEIEWKEPPEKALMQDECIGIEWTISSGEFKNRRLFQNLRIRSEDEKLHDKGMAILATLYCIAGKDITKITREPGDTELNKILQNLKANLKIGLMKGKDGEQDRNYIKVIKSTKVPADKDEDGDDIPY